MRPFYEQIKPIRCNRQNVLDFPLHIHDAVEIVYVLRGSSTVLLENQQLTLSPGDLFISFPHQVHGYENSRDFLGYVVIITTQTIPVFQSLLQQNQPAVPIFHPEGDRAEQLHSLLEMMWSDRKTTSPTLLQGYSQVLLSKLLTFVPLVPTHQEPGVLQSVLQYIDLHHNEILTRDQIAEAVGYSPSYISHVFTEAMGTSLRDYITRLRMNDAKKMLLQTDLPVGQIAMSLGFPSIRSFNRFFLLDTGITPTAYRSQEVETQP